MFWRVYAPVDPQGNLAGTVEKRKKLNEIGGEQTST